MTTKSEFRQLVLQEGVPAAYAAMMRVLKDPRSSSTAISTVSRTMLEAGGVLKTPDDVGETEPHEMTSDELAKRIAHFQHERSNRAKPVIDSAVLRIASSAKGVFD